MSDFTTKMTPKHLDGIEPWAVSWQVQQNQTSSRSSHHGFHFIILMPLLSVFEQPGPLPHSISEPVLKGGGLAPARAHAKPMEKA